LVPKLDVGVGHNFTAPANPLRGFSASKFPRFSASFARGVGHLIGCKKFRGDLPADLKAIALVLLASGVGNNPDSVASVRGANGGSWYAVPLCVIPDLGQVSENFCKPSTKQC